MKKIILFLLFVIPVFAGAQTSECNCSGPLDEDLKDKFSATEYRDFKDWLYSYFQKDQTTRTQMKNEKKFGWGGKLTTVIESLPVTMGSDMDWSGAKENQKYYRIEQSYLKNSYLTDEQFNELIVDKFDINQLEAYKACLELCRQSIGNGVFYLTGNDTRDEFYIQVTYKSNSGGQQITLNGNAQYSNLEPIGGLLFTDALIIANGQSKTQYFKRVDPGKPASFTINVKESIGNIRPVEFDAKPPVNQQAVPIGTIVASVLNYRQFLKVNGLDALNNDDMTKALWIPCDGRTENKSKYSAYSGGNIPDLRGVFLRGINNYGVTFPSVVAVSSAQKNPDNSAAGQFQADGIKTHTHKYQVGNAVNGHNYNTEGGEFFHRTVRKRTTEANNDAEPETRPKNVTVYYYIKIN